MAQVTVTYGCQAPVSIEVGRLEMDLGETLGQMVCATYATAHPSTEQVLSLTDSAMERGLIPWEIDTAEQGPSGVMPAATGAW